MEPDRRWPMWLAILTVVLCACGQGAPQLITVREMLPREAEIGDTLEISGEGFPQGRAARVRFLGSLHRPGLAPERAEIEASGTATSPTSVAVNFDEELQARFCGVGRSAVHTTFTGEIEVGFSPAIEGAPPVVGRAAGATLDARPPASPRATEAARDEGLRALAALGVRVEDGARPGGLVVSAVDPESRAESAGLLAGDVLVAWSDVRVRSLADVALPPDASQVRVALLRGGSPAEQTREIAVAGVSARRTPDLYFPAIALALALGISLAIGARRPRFQIELEAAPKRAPTLAELAWALLAALAPYAVVALGREVDALLVVVASIASAAAAAIALRASVLRAAGALVPFALALLAASHATGALGLGALVRAQGALPWRWQAARDPFAPALLLLALAPLAGSPRRGRLARGAGVGFVSGVLVIALLGGWRAPGSGALALAAGLALYAAKVIPLALAVLALRGPVLPLFRVLIPAAAAAATASVVTAELAPPALARCFLAASALALPPLVAAVLRASRPEPRLSASALSGLPR